MELLSEIKKSICLETCITAAFLTKDFWDKNFTNLLGLSETKFLSSNLDIWGCGSSR